MASSLAASEFWRTSGVVCSATKRGRAPVCQANLVVNEELQHPPGPVLKSPLARNEELFVLLQKVRDIYNCTLPVQLEVTNKAIHGFMESTLRRIKEGEFTALASSSATL